MDKGRNRISYLATSDNSGHTTTLRSPKPLRASHTRKSLCAIPNPTEIKGIYVLNVISKTAE